MSNRDECPHCNECSHYDELFDAANRELHTLRALVGELVAECEQPTIKGGHYELIARAKAATGTKE